MACKHDTPSIKVGIGLIEHDGKYLIGQRSKQTSNKACVGYWEFPGGKVEAHETVTETIRREIQEELAMRVNVGKHRLTMTWTYGDDTYELIIHDAKLDNPDQQTITDKLHAHDRTAWVTMQQALQYNMLPSNVIIIQQMLQTHQQ